MLYNHLPGSPKNWDEDFEHENGNYICKCKICKSEFVGHKRRVMCKECANPSFRVCDCKDVEKIKVVIHADHIIGSELCLNCIFAEQMKGFWIELVGNPEKYILQRS